MTRSALIFLACVASSCAFETSCLAQCTIRFEADPLEYDSSNGHSRVGSMESPLLPPGFPEREMWEVAVLTEGAQETVLGLSFTVRAEFQGFHYSQILLPPSGLGYLTGDAAAVAVADLHFDLEGHAFAGAEFVDTGQEYTPSYGPLSLVGGFHLQPPGIRTLHLAVVQSFTGAGVSLPSGPASIAQLRVLLPAGALRQDGDGATITIQAGTGLATTPHEMLYASGTIDPLTVEAHTLEFRPAHRFQRGRFDSDGNLTVFDAVQTLLYLFTNGAPPPCLDSLDVNDDGVLNLNDPVQILQYLFVGGADPAAPFAECEFDPTPDDLSCEQQHCAPPPLGQPFPRRLVP